MRFEEFGRDFIVVLVFSLRLCGSSMIVIVGSSDLTRVTLDFRRRSLRGPDARTVSFSVTLGIKFACTAMFFVSLTEDKLRF